MAMRSVFESQWVLVLLIMPSFAQANGLRCVDIYRTQEASPLSSMIDESGFIDLYGRNRNLQESRLEPGDALTQPEFLMNMGRAGRRQVRSNQWAKETLNQFLRLSHLTAEKVADLTVTQQLAILNAFGNWNLIAPNPLMVRLQANLQGKLTDWTAQEFLKFALFRKISPQGFSSLFLKAYREAVVFRFQELEVATQLEVLGAELIHGNRWTARQTQALLEQTADSLQSNTGILRLKPIKEFYRGLIHLRATEPTVYFHSIVRLEGLIESQLNRQNLSLNDGGTSGSNNPVRPFGPSFVELQRRIDTLWPGQEKIYEAMEASILGLYDPVDVYYPGLRLIVEWDGPIHYFRQLNENGRLDARTFVLRPLDASKDRSLQQIGLSVLRWPKHMNPWVETISINDLILSQNPHTWEPPR